MPMTSDEVLAMLKIRREPPLHPQKNGVSQDAVTPDSIEKSLADKQLAAALKALVGKITQDKWPTVGLTGVKARARKDEIERLRQIETEMKDRLDEIHEKIKKLEKGEPAPDNDDDTTTDDKSQPDKQPQPQP